MLRMLKDLARRMLPASLLKQIDGRRFANKSPQEVFDQIYQSHHWNEGGESISGRGSELAETAVIRKELPELFRKYEIKTVLDIPCGDMNWMSEVLENSQVSYTGGDIVQDLVRRNQKQLSSDRVRFQHMNLIEDDLPKVDLVISRDCWIHFSYENIQASVRNLKRSGSTYLLASTYPATPANRDIVTGNSRTIDLQKAPFNFPAPLELIHENVPNPPNAYNASKSMALWRIADLPE